MNTLKVAVLSGLLASVLVTVVVAQIAKPNRFRPTIAATNQPLLSGKQLTRVPTQQESVMAADHANLANQINPHLTPVGVAWANQTAIAVLNGTMSEDQVQLTASTRRSELIGTRGEGENADVQSLVFVVLHIALTSDRADLLNTSIQVQKKNRTQAQRLPPTGPASELAMISLENKMHSRATMLFQMTSMLKSLNESQRGIVNNIR